MLPQKRVLMAINEPDITKILTLSLKKYFGQKYDLSIAETPYAGRLLALAQRETADLFILLLNNMFYSDIPSLLEKNRVESGLAVITYLKETYQKPVIAMTGWYPYEGSWTVANTKQAGASFLLFIPVEGSLFRNVVRHCFEETEPAHL